MTVGLSARFLNSNITNMAIGVPIVVMNEVGKPGMLRILGANSFNADNTTNIKIELDGVVLFNDFINKIYSLNDQQTGWLRFGMPIISEGSTTFPTNIERTRRLFNLPFNDSIKITITNNNTVIIGRCSVNAEYVLDIK